jgi:anti-sigma B factor antagonist
MDRSNLKIDVRDTPAALELTLRGELDLATVDAVRHAFAVNVDGQALVTVDLAGVTFIDSTGIRALLEINDTPHTPPVQFINPSAQVDRILELTGIRGVLRWAKPRET